MPSHCGFDVVNVCFTPCCQYRPKDACIQLFLQFLRMQIHSHKHACLQAPVSSTSSLARGRHGGNITFAIANVRLTASAQHPGCIPPLWGSAVYRSIMMSSYEASFTFFEQQTDSGSFWHREYFGKVVRPLVVASTVACSLCRCVAEAPIEQARCHRPMPPCANS
jgi:hypothetical protein